MKTKIILFLIIFLLLSMSSFALEDVYLKINTTGDQKPMGRLAGGDYFLIAQSFDYNGSVNKYISRINVTTIIIANIPTCFLQVRTDNGSGYPSNLTIAESNPFTCNTLGLKSIVMFRNGTYSLVPFNKYHVVFNTTETLGVGTLTYFTYNTGTGNISDGKQTQKQIGTTEWITGDLDFDIAMAVYINDTKDTNDTINITTTQPLNNTQFNNNNLQINATIQTNNPFTCNLYINNTLNQTTSSSYCYQETADVSTSCGGLNTGVYSSYPNIDNWAYLYVNYTKPLNSTYGGFWQIKHGLSGIINVTIPYDCWNANQSLISFAMLSKHYSGDLESKSNATCWNGTIWKTLSSQSGTFLGNTPSGGISTSKWMDGYWNTGISSCIGCFGAYRDSSNVDPKNAVIYEEGIFWNMGIIQPDISNFTNISFNNSFYDGSYNYNLTCTDENTTETSNTAYFYIDTISPTLPNVTFSNLSAFSSIRGSNITGQFNFSDETILHSINVTILNSTGGLYASLFNITDLTSKTYSYNMTFNPINYPVGNYTLRTVFADGHTDNTITNYLVEETMLGNSITYIKDNDNSIMVNPLNWGSLTTTKKKDRYTFDFEPMFKKKKLSFEVKSQNIIYLKKAAWTPYNEWLVSGVQWIDFYSPENPNMKITYEKQDDYTYLVTLDNVDDKKDKIKFTSIGDLNIVTQDYYFAITNATITYSSPTTDNTLTTHSFSINKTNLITSTGAYLIWNNTAKTVIKTINANYDFYNSTFLIPDIAAHTLFNFTWFYNITSSINETGNISANQTVLDIEIDNCTTGNISLNIAFYDESNPTTRINTTLDYYMNFTLEDNPVSVDFSRQLTGANNYSICINPANATFSATILNDFSATGFEKRNYWIQNISLNGSSNYQLNLYHINSSTTNLAKVNLYLTDDNDNVLSGWFIKVLKFDFSTNTYLNSESLKTDLNGQSMTNLALYTTRYMFIITDTQGIVRLTTTQEEIYLTNIFFKVNLQNNPMSLINDLTGISAGIVFNNATNNFTLTFNDPSSTITGATLTVIKRTPYGDSVISTNSVSGTGGTIVGATDGTNGTFIATATINGQSTYNTWTIESTTATIGSAFNNWGLMGLFLAGFIGFTLFAAGMWNPAVSSFLLILGIIITWWLGILGLGLGSVMLLAFIGGIIVFKVRT